MKLIKNYLYNTGYQLLALIVPLITSAYVSRTLKPRGVGINAFTNSIIQYFIILASVGIGIYGNRQIAYVRENKIKRSETFWEIQIIKIFTTIISLIFFIVFMHFYSYNAKYMWAQSINLIAVVFDISWLYEGMENFKITVTKNSIVKVISMILIFLLIKSSDDVILYIILLGFSVLLGNITLWPTLKKDLVKINVKKLHPLQHFLPIMQLFIPQIAMQVYVQLNQTMLGVLKDQTAAGFYQYSNNIVQIVLSLVSSLGVVMLPHMSNALSKGNITKVNFLTCKSFNFISCLAFPVMFGLASISRTLVPLYYGNGYEAVGSAIFFESIVIIMIGWSGVIGYQYFLSTKKTKYYTISVIIGTLVNLILNLPFIKFWGLNGAMVAMVMSETSVTLYQIIIVRRYIPLYKLFKEVWKYFVAGLIMFIIVSALNKILVCSWITIILEVLVGIIIYCVILIVFKASVLKDLQKVLKNDKRKKV